MARRTEVGQLLTELILQVFRVNGRLLAAGDAVVADTGQTSARWQVLGSVSYGPVTVADIARRTGRRRQSVQELADRLEADGLIHFAPHPHDRRTKLAQLTTEGEAMRAELTARQIRWVNRLARELDPAELTAALRALDALELRLNEEAR